MTDPHSFVAQGMADRALEAYRGGRFDRCLDLAALGLQLAPEAPGLLYLRGLALFAVGRAPEAVDDLRAAVAGDPSRPEYFRDLGLVLAELGEPFGAQAALAVASQGLPDDAGVLTALAVQDLALGHTAEGERRLVQSLALDPDRVETLFHLGVLRFHLDRPDEALALLGRAAELAPDRASVWTNLGVVWKRLGRLDRALECQSRALDCSPDHAESHYNLAHALLMAGHWAEGFAEYEWRLRRPGHRLVQAGPAWDGSDLGGGTLLLTAEQGIGDLVQFARYVPLAARRGCRVVVECHPGLEGLLSLLPGVDACLTVGAPLPACDAWAPLVSLPHLLGGLPPPPPPYLPRPLPMQPLPPAPKGALKVGLVWSCNTANLELAGRSAPLAALAEPLLAAPAVALYSLQKGEASAELAAYAGRITDLGPCIHSFLDTAAFLVQLDLVISVDTSVAHVAAAMGVPVWVLLSGSQHDYRWGQGDGSPWYPEVRLLRARQGWEALGAALPGLLAAAPPPRGG